MKTENRRQRGSAMLEYTMAAAVLIGIVWMGMSAMGNSVRSVLDEIATWAGARKTQIQTPK